MSGLGVRKFRRKAGQMQVVSFDGMPEYLPYGFTIDWANVTAAASDTTLADGTDVKTGDKYVLMGTVMYFGLDGSSLRDVAKPTTGDATAEVDTFTPTTVTTGDINSVTTPGGISAQFTIGGTATATAAVTGLKAAWNANPALTAIATASGTTTLILTAVAGGVPMNLNSSVVGTGTLPKVITTPTTVTPAGGLVQDRCFILSATVFEDDGPLTDTPGGGIIGGKVFKSRVRAGGTGQPTIAALRAAMPRLVLVED